MRLLQLVELCRLLVLVHQLLQSFVLLLLALELLVHLRRLVTPLALL